MYSFCCYDQQLFEQKNIFVSLSNKIQSIVRLTDEFHQCKLITFSSLRLYIVKLIARLTVTNIWVFLHNILMIHKL